MKSFKKKYEGLYDIKSSEISKPKTKTKPKISTINELLAEIKKETGWVNLAYVKNGDKTIEEYADSFKKYIDSLKKKGKPDYEKTIVDSTYSYFDKGNEEFKIKTYSGKDNNSRFTYFCEIVFWKDVPIYVSGYGD